LGIHGKQSNITCREEKRLQFAQRTMRDGNVTLQLGRPEAPLVFGDVGWNRSRRAS
jgi:hypothetical protein